MTEAKDSLRMTEAKDSLRMTVGRPLRMTKGQRHGDIMNFGFLFDTLTFKLLIFDFV